MGCIEYAGISAYLQSKTALKDRIIAIDILIDKAILLMGDTIDGAGGNISSYELDDGQVSIKTGYRSMNDVAVGIKSLETMRSLYENRLYGRSCVLRDRSTFR